MISVSIVDGGGRIVEILLLLKSLIPLGFSEPAAWDYYKLPSLLTYYVPQDHQKLQASLSVAVNSIISIVTGSTSSSFRKICLQALQVSRRLGLLKSARVLMTFYYLTQCYAQSFQKHYLILSYCCPTQYQACGVLRNIY